MHGWSRYDGNLFVNCAVRKCVSSCISALHDSYSGIVQRVKKCFSVLLHQKSTANLRGLSSVSGVAGISLNFFSAKAKIMLRSCTNLVGKHEADRGNLQ